MSLRPKATMDRLIELVRVEPCLYDTNHPEYSKKILKDLLWDNISKKSNYRNGPAAKDAWLKLRNCHRDAIRRRQRLLNDDSAPAAKPWRYEKQMEFLIPYMANHPSTVDTSIENVEPALNQSENFTNYSEIEFVAALQQSDTLRIEGCSGIPRTSTINSVVDVSRDSINKIDLDSIITRTLDYHEERVKEKTLKRANDQESDDELQQFFNTMYTVTKKMPALSQHKIKRQIFNLVSDEEELLLKLKVNNDTLSMPSDNPGTPKMSCSDNE